MRRAEELQDWIAQTTEQPVEEEHLSVVLQDGQLLCLLANALDPLANVKVNKLTTVFHSKANIRAFLDWCKKQGLQDSELFEADDLLDGTDFNAVVATLSILYDKFGGAYVVSESIDFGQENPALSDSETSSGTATPEPTTPKKTTSNSKLASFMKASFFTLSSKPKRPATPEGTPPSTPPPMSPPQAPATPPRRNRNSSAVSTQSNNSRLNAFLNQVPASQEKPLEHVDRPAGPPKRAPSVRKENRPLNVPTPPATPPRKMSTPPSTPPRKASNGARTKFAAFMQANPPAAGDAPPLPRGGRTESNSSQSSNAPQVNLPVDNSFADRRAAFEPKKNAPPQAPPKPRSPPPPASKKSSVGDNKLKDFMNKQPPASTGAIKGRSDSSNSKLAAFIATTGVAPSISNTPAPRSAPSPLASFNPGGKTPPKPLPPANNAYANRNVPSSAPVASAPVAQASNSGERFPFTPRRVAERSTGRGNYVRKRQTYRQFRAKPKRFSLEDKRAKFMHEQLQLKEEQLRLQALGAASAKQNLIVPGVQCYVPDKEEVWMLSEIVEYNDRTKQVTIDAFLDSGETERRNVNLKDPEVIRALAGPSATEVESLPVAILHDTPGGVDDMRLLRYLNEPSILFNLKQRFEASKPYTYTNDIVIAVNPYKWIDGLYGDHLHDQYLRKPRDTIAPHVYSTSTAAYKHMTTNEQNQSILVSGESGAGKTETTKIVMNHLASVAGGRQDKTIAKVIDVNPLLESFGNAKTTRNDNSSRFGKFTQLQFNSRGKLIGAKCETYLLEKSRVVSITDGERNYHIFYQLLAGLNKREQSDLELDPSFKYQYTGLLNSMKIPGIDDAKWLDETRKSLSLIGLNESAQKTLFQILAGVLILGEVTFLESGESGSMISSTKELAQVARLFGCPTERIQAALCNRTVITRNDAVTVPLDPVEAVENRDALAKTIYSKMFDWMVTKINNAISSDESDIHAQIGVLDIFGFEDFVQNGFEQFCINYANEKLQQKFTNDVFKTVEDEYIREGLEWDHIQYQDNKDIVEIIDGKMGIIALMNDHLRQPRGTEEALVNKFKTNHHKKGTEVNPHIDFPKVKRTQFIINHYAGSVTYETVGFMEKHRDTLQKDLLDLIQASNIPLLVELFDDSESLTDSNGGGARSKAGPKSLGSQFKQSLSQLMENISCTNSHYVRCIKPNSNKSSTEFNKRMVVEQLRSAGVVEAIRITRSAYPSRLSPQELASRYCIMFPPSMHSPDVRRTCSIFMTAIGRKAPLEYQMGKTLIYFKNGVMEELEAMKSDFMYTEATCIQKIVLGFVYRRRLARKIRAAIVLQSYSRMVIERNEFLFQRQAIVKIQRRWRRYLSGPVAVVEDVHSEADDSIRDSVSSDGGQWVDEMDEFDDPIEVSSIRPPSRSVLERMRGYKDDSMTPGGRRSSLKRLGDLSSRAKSFMRNSGGSSLTGSSGMSMEDENSMLRIENRNLKYDLELMREQCIELQAIILEINKSRKR
ncbi:hypothetical protein Poli38472_000546 [Pythium oligandrum]|uniref:Uncharacterized protein n=1 Tax=Pythium oligandrum TaxID=41045 RepID=A0A8K1CBT9_PYTOL|nr:hypothetical protein Poli38472_000546 [Pythium oligandrum]|eukprot:TMW60504.1 hypothetical protein Poli38472_000546 [Pythium oligandrum]